MRVLVMGTGAVGGYFGASLARNGEDVVFVARGEHRDTIEANGLRVESVAAGDYTVRAPAVEQPPAGWTADLVLFCVKGYHNPQAIEVVRPAVGDRMPPSLRSRTASAAPTSSPPPLGATGSSRARPTSTPCAPPRG